MYISDSSRGRHADGLGPEHGLPSVTFGPSIQGQVRGQSEIGFVSLNE